MFVVWIGSVVVTVSAIVDPSVFAWLVAVWLWFTVVFANLAEAVAEGRGRAQADALRRTRTDTLARRLVEGGGDEEVGRAAQRSRTIEEVGTRSAAEPDHRGGRTRSAAEPDHRGGRRDGAADRRPRGGLGRGGHPW